MYLDILNNFGQLGIFVTLIGLIGIMKNNLNFLISMLSIEIMLYGLIIFIILVGLFLDDFFSQVFSLFILTLAACESGGALGLLMNHYKVYKNILLR